MCCFSGFTESSMLPMYFLDIHFVFLKLIGLLIFLYQVSIVFSLQLSVSFAWFLCRFLPKNALKSVVREKFSIFHRLKR